MSFSAVSKIVEERFEDQWTATPYVFAEQPRKTEWTEWARCSVNFANSQNAALGTKVRESGFVYIQLFTAQNVGTRASLDLAETARNIFQNQTFGKLNFYAGSVVQVGRNGPFLQTNVKIEFYYQ